MNLFTSCLSPSSRMSYKNNKKDVLHFEDVPSISSEEVIIPPVSIHHNGKDNKHNNTINCKEVPATASVPSQSEDQVPACANSSAEAAKESGNKFSRTLKKIKPRNLRLSEQLRRRISMLSNLRKRSANKITPYQEEAPFTPSTSNNTLRSIHTSVQHEKVIPNWSYHSYCGSLGLGHWSCTSCISSRTKNVSFYFPSEVKEQDLNLEQRSKDIEELVMTVRAELIKRCEGEEDMDQEKEIERLSEIMTDLHVNNSKAKVELEVVDL